MFQYEAEVLRIVDGDTLWLEVHLGFKIRLEVDVRLANLNAPDVVQWTPSGLSEPAMNYVSQCVPPGSTCIVDIQRAEKYGRWLAVIYYLKGSTDREEIGRSGHNLNDELIKLGLAQQYSGGKKPVVN
jgi:endonuclease YncB( thermonuclease family)